MPTDPEGVILSSIKSEGAPPLTRTLSKSKEFAMTQMERVHPLRIALDLFILSMAFMPVIICATAIYPYRRGFYCDDDTIYYPYRDSTVANINLYVFGLAIPLFSILIIEAYRTYVFEPRCLNTKCEPKVCVNGKPCSLYGTRLYYYIGYFLFGAALCQTLTDIGKYSVGRLRPHFVSVCQPTWSKLNCTGHQYVEEPYCTGDESKIREGRLSFPSGHSSFGFYSMMFTIFYLQAQLVWPLASRLVKHTIQFIFLCVALGTALSRISDYKHHWSDVFSGSILGIVSATFVVSE
uniref:Phosphatidic acid phosphatase type 2/haloperoxidase domain-containing protein n=1 Tax=Romanomermis culicivorax TaxID=13658 RepID=A0A915JGA7_ROMCU